MVYLYAALGMVMLSGIMTIFEMGLSLTGQSLLSTPPDPYFLGSPGLLSPSAMQMLDRKFQERLEDEEEPFDDLVKAQKDLLPEEQQGQALCAALDTIDGLGWLLITEEGDWQGGCQRNQMFDIEGDSVSHRMIIRENPEVTKNDSYQLFSCSRLYDGETAKCYFDFE